MNIATISHEQSNSIVKIEKGELISFQFNNEELMKQKNAPGWKHTDTEMFPIIGPTSQNNYEVDTPKGTCIQDQHGLLRLMDYSVVNHFESSISFEKKYIANTSIRNAKFPQSSEHEFLSWPYDFTFKKNFHLNENGLLVTFEIHAEDEMPFMLGYHPNFKLSGSGNETITTKSHNESITEVLEIGDDASPLFNISELRLNKENGHDILIKTKGFDNCMLWTPVASMICIEPITAYPFSDGGIAKGKVFRKVGDSNYFEVLISPVN